MELSKKHQQCLYNICQLILKHKYKRAIYISQYLESQGLSSHQLLTLKSYAISKVEGYKAAIESIKYQDGPLLSFAKGQYKQALHLWEEANQQYLQLISGEEKGPIDNIVESNQIIAKKGIQGDIKLAKSDKVTFFSNNNELQIVRKINQITTQYYRIKKQKENKELSQEQYKEECNKMIDNYDQLLHRNKMSKQLRHQLKQYILFLEQSISF